MKSAVEKHFSALPGYKSGDLISQSQVKSALTDLAKQGWKPTDEKDVLAAVLADSEFLVGLLRKGAGQKFMREVSGRKLVYDRLDRMSASAQGRKMVVELTSSLGNRWLYDELASTPRGAQLVDALGNNPDGVDLNSPTGKIYTVEQLLSRLEKSYSADAKRQGIKDAPAKKASR